MTKKLVLLSVLSLMALSCCMGWYAAQHYRVSASSSENILYYVCPMHPRFTSDRPGDCPSCGMRLVPYYAKAKSSTSAEIGATPPGAVDINPSRQQVIGVRTDEVQKGPIEYTLRTLGRVAADETKIVRLTAADGWVEEVFPSAADTVVEKDQLLAKFYSREFITAELAYLYTLDAPEKLVKDRQGQDRSTANIQARSADKELRSLGMSEYQMKEIARTRQAVTEIELRSPIAGFVLARNINAGMKFDRGAELYRIADLSHVWIYADLFENEAVFFRPGMKANVSLPQQGRTLQAIVSGVLPQFDPQTRTLKVRLEVDNPGYRLRPDMFVDVDLKINKPSAIAIKNEALLYTGSGRRVFVDAGNGYFVPRKVQTGTRLGDRVEIIGGLVPGERIVSSGAFLIDSESRMGEPATEEAMKMPVRKTSKSGEPVKDIVCGMKVDTQSPQLITAQYESKTYYFCSEQCKKDFEANPDKYIQAQGRQSGAKMGM
jgi:membrane fusion protein, copper/silver efflux system